MNAGTQRLAPMIRGDVAASVVPANAGTHLALVGCTSSAEQMQDAMDPSVRWDDVLEG